MPRSPGPICRQLTGGKVEGHEETDTVRIGSLTESAECGCRYCYLACESVKKQVQNSPMEIDHFHTYFDEFGLRFRSALIVEDEEFFVVDSASDPVLPVVKPIPEYTGSEESYQTAINWLKECLDTHETLCPTGHRRGEPPNLPLRVIDVNGIDSGDIRLVQTAGKRGYYACLSHCWGGEQPLKTTLTPDTLSSHQQGIPWEDIPKTFQDAIEITRRIGLQYIWIDSLCIVQDDTADWETQSAQMGKIYQNSVICIAGSASSGPHKGLFHKAHPSYVGSRLSNTRDLLGLDKIYSRTPLRHSTKHFPLLNRGWVFQERLLSPRYLHFGDQELMWECMEQTTCECGRLGHDESAKLNWIEPKNRLHATSLQYFSKEKTSLAWRTVVRDYSSLRFSKGSDIFPAVSGLAQRIGEATGWEYIAGMWKETLVVDLGWTITKPESSRRCMPWRAPTFSWASVVLKNPDSEETINSPVCYDRVALMNKELNDSGRRIRKTNTYATILKVECKTTGSDATGELESAHMILSGTLVRAQLHRPLPRHIAPMGGSPLLSSTLHPDFDYSRDDSLSKDRNEVYCLKLIGSSSIPERSTGESLLHLLLKKVNSDPWESGDVKGSGIFERIGLLRDAYDEDEEKLEQVSAEVDIKYDVLVKIR